MRGAPAFLLSLLVGALGAACGERAGDGGGREETPVAPAARTRGALSTTLRAALDAGDLAGAEAALAGLERDHEGVGEMPDGRTLSRAAVSGAVFDAAVALARRAVEGPTPDRARAEHALEVASRHVPEEGEAAVSLAAARRWVGLRTLADLTTPLAPHAGPRVVAVADVYDLGEMGLLLALKRWSAEGAREGLRVGVVPMVRGWVRVGLRRARARDRAEERTALAAALAGTNVVVEPEPLDPEAVARDVGLLGLDAAVLVFDRAGRLVGRFAGRNLDPAALDVVVQRATSR